MRVVTKKLSAGLLAATVLATMGAVGSLALPAVAATSSPVAAGAVTPGTGFAYGTDSWPMTVTGSGPYKEPVLGTGYGGYMGMAGNWARTLGCSTGNFLAWSAANAGQANANFRTYHVGVGTGVYYPVPVHTQPAYRHHANPSCPRAEAAATDIFSIPVHPGVSDAERKVVAEAVNAL